MSVHKHLRLMSTHKNVSIISTHSDTRNISVTHIFASFPQHTGVYLSMRQILSFSRT